MRRKIIFYAFTFLCTSLFFSCDFKKETKHVTSVTTESKPDDSVIVKKGAELQNNKPLQDIFTTIDFNKFSDIITENDKRKLNIFLPITRVEKYTSLGEEYVAVFTEDKAIPESPDFPNSRINFYLLKKRNPNENLNHNYEVVNKFSNNYYSIYNKYDTKLKFLNNVCDFNTVDDNGIITPIIITQEKHVEYNTERTNIYIFSEEKMIPIQIDNEPEETTGIYVSPFFYTLSNTVQDKVKQIINDIDGIRVEPYSEEFEDYIGFESFWDTKKCFWDGSTDPIIYQSSQAANANLKLPSAPSNSLDDLKDIYESTFPTSQNISFDFGINLHHEPELHSGSIYNNLDTSVILPDAKLEYFFVSDENKVLTQTIFEHKFLLLKPNSSQPFDDNSIDYNLNDGYHAINWNYQNGWESEHLRLFPKELQEGKYVAYAKLSYFDGEQEQSPFF